MRIIAGSLGGRNFLSPRGNRTRPMSEKVRGALFNVLGDIEGLTVLDAFSGSGAIGLEALSRGALHVTAIDSDRNAQRAISQNITDLGLNNRMKLIKATVSAWISTSADTFDVVICDPPYGDLQEKVLPRIAERTRPHGTLVLSLPPAKTVELGENFSLISSKDYGDACLQFYRREA